MFTKEELKSTIKVCDAKIADLLQRETKSNNLDYIRKLQGLITLKDAAEKKMDTAI